MCGTTVSTRAPMPWTCSCTACATRSTSASSRSCCTRFAVSDMSSKWSEGFKTALMLRLGLWYAALFAIGAMGLLLFTYALLGRALAAQDRDVLASTLSRYAAEYGRSGLVGLRRLVDA